MNTLKLKYIALSFLATLIVTVFMTSCEQENIEDNIETTINEEYLNQDLESINERVAAIKSSIKLPHSFTGTEDEVSTFVKGLSKEDFRTYQKEYIISEFFVENGIMTTFYDEAWKDISLSNLNFSDFLNQNKIQELNNKLAEIETAPTLQQRSDCCWHEVYVQHNCGCGGDYVWVYECTTNTVILFEGNNATQDIVGELDVHYDRSINFTSSNCCPNDEARSAVLWNMKAGQQIALYDDSNPNCSNNPASNNFICQDNKDDWMIITVKRDFESKVINSFEEVFSDADVTALYGNGGNLDGKVSRFKCKN